MNKLKNINHKELFIAVIVGLLSISASCFCIGVFGLVMKGTDKGVELLILLMLINFFFLGRTVGTIHGRIIERNIYEKQKTNR